MMNGMCGIDYLSRPFRASSQPAFGPPGRCPGLPCCCPVGARSCGPLTPAAEFKLPPVISDTGRDDDPIDGLFDRIEMTADEDVNGSGDYARTVVATTPQGRPPEQTSFRVAAAPRGGRTITDAYRYSVCDTKTDYALGLATDPQEPSSESSDFKMNHRSVAAVESKPSTSWGSLTPGSV